MTLAAGTTLGGYEIVDRSVPGMGEAYRARDTKLGRDVAVTPELLTEPDPDKGEKTHRLPEILPYGKHLLFTIGTGSMSSYDEAQIAILDLETGEQKVLVEGGSNPHYLSTGHVVYSRDGTLTAAELDLDALEIRGVPHQVLGGVLTSRQFGVAQFAVFAGERSSMFPGLPTFSPRRVR